MTGKPTAHDSAHDGYAMLCGASRTHYIPGLEMDIC
jgi:hypothetical protein